MGMDVYAKNADSKVGEYFRNNCWWWRPLARYCCDVAPEVTSACQYWQSNDGDGLDAEGAKALAAELRKRLESGEVGAYAKEYKAKLDSLPSERCKLCEGTGVRRDVIGVEAGMPEKDNPHSGHKGWCNGCDGKGEKRPNDTWYPFSVENVKEFAEFLEHCGGFKIC